PPMIWPAVSLLTEAPAGIEIDVVVSRSSIALAVAHAASLSAFLLLFCAAVACACRSPAIVAAAENDATPMKNLLCAVLASTSTACALFNAASQSSRVFDA